jgi:hypothetical protein
MRDPFSRDAYRKTAGWVRRKVKDSDKWVARWIEVNRHVLYSYQNCPAESPQARVMNMLDLRKTQHISLVDGGVEGLFVIVPVSANGRHPGWLMKACHPKSAEEWVRELNKVRAHELEMSRDLWTRRGAHIVLRALVEKHPPARAPEGGCFCGLLSRRRDAVSAFLYEVAPDGPFRNIVSFL